MKDLTTEQFKGLVSDLEKISLKRFGTLTYSAGYFSSLATELFAHLPDTEKQFQLRIMEKSVIKLARELAEEV